MASDLVALLRRKKKKKTLTVPSNINQQFTLTTKMTVGRHGRGEDTDEVNRT